MPERTENVVLAQPDARISVRDTLRATFAQATAVVAYAIPMALVGTLSYVVLVAVTPTGKLVYANNALQFIELPTASLVALTLPLILLALAVHVFASAAAQLVVTGNLVARPVPLGVAWQQAARTLARVLPPAAIVALAVTAAAAIAVTAFAVGAPLWLSLAIFVILLALIFPLVYLESLAVLRPLPARTAWREMRAIGRALNDAGMLARIRVAIPIALGVGAILVLRWVSQSVSPTLMNFTLFGIGAVLVAMATATAAIAEISRLTLEGLSRQSSPQSIRLTTAGGSSRAGTVGGWAAAVAAVVLPCLLVLAGIGLNPTNVPIAAVAQIATTEPSLQTADAGSGVVVSLSHEWGNYQMALCTAGVCDASQRISVSALATAIATDPAGGILVARWVDGDQSGDGRGWNLVVSHLSASQAVQTWNDPSGIELGSGTLTVIDTVVTPEDTSDLTVAIEGSTDLAIDTSGQFPVIASLSGLGQEGPVELSILRCIDVTCSSVTKESTTVRSQAYSSLLTSIDLAVSDDGTAFVTVRGFSESADNFDDDTALVVAPPEGSLTITKIITGTDAGSSFLSDPWAGNALEVTSDGTAAVLYRLMDSGTFELLTCADAACTTSSTQTLPGLNTATFFPAMTVDRTGRPLIATYSENGKSVVVLSCDDSACSTFESRVIAPASSSPTPLGISLDRAGLPIVTIGNSVDGTVYLEEQSRIVFCRQPRCGAD